jgi:hypothetical protein
MLRMLKISPCSFPTLFASAAACARHFPFDTSLAPAAAALSSLSVCVPCSENVFPTTWLGQGWWLLSRGDDEEDVMIFSVSVRLSVDFALPVYVCEDSMLASSGMVRQELCVVRTLQPLLSVSVSSSSSLTTAVPDFDLTLRQPLQLDTCPLGCMDENLGTPPPPGPPLPVDFPLSRLEADFTLGTLAPTPLFIPVSAIVFCRRSPDPDNGSFMGRSPDEAPIPAELVLREGPGPEDMLSSLLACPRVRAEQEDTCRGVVYVFPF